MPDESLTEGKQGAIHISNYQDDMRDWIARVTYYMSNKSTMNNVVLGQCDPAMQINK